MIKQTIPNFYVPGISKEISLKLQIIDINDDTPSYKNEIEKHDDSEITYGIIDWSKQNNLYKKLIETLGISDMTNLEIKQFVINSLINKFGIAKHSGIKDLTVNAIMRMTWRSIIIGIQSRLKQIFLWKNCHYSIRSIAAKLSIPKEKVNEILSKYKTNVRRIVKAKKKICKNSRLTIEFNILQTIRDYWNCPTKTPIKIKDIKEHIWSSYKLTKVPHYSTISRILRNELSMSYKVLQKRHPKQRLQIVLDFFM